MKAQPEDDLIKNCRVIDNTMSDHYAVHFELNRSKPSPRQNRTKTRNFQDIDMDDLTNAFSDQLKPLLLLQDVDDQTQFFTDTVTTV